ncbi:MAG: hypothetical protein CSB33_04065 [Desulfobacterales bacterium]|nr:MAG: hypothetical protein CSB33_04065 [Desulfobacterales bacterium]
MAVDLRKIPLFSCLNSEELKALEKVCVIRKVPRNTILFSEGDISDSFYVVMEGRVTVCRSDEDGREVILSILGPGEYFGEMALMDGEPRSACIMTKIATRLLVISRKDFHVLLDEHPELMFSLLVGLQKRLREANRIIESLALRDVYGRVARLLINLAGGNAGDEEDTVRERLTHQEIANMVGASREMVSRVLKDLSNDGYIRIEKKRITILTPLPYAR